MERLCKCVTAIRDKSCPQWTCLCGCRLLCSLQLPEEKKKSDTRDRLEAEHSNIFSFRFLKEITVHKHSSDRANKPHFQGHTE